MIIFQQLAILLLIGVPNRAMVTNYSEAESIRIYFLAHVYPGVLLIVNVVRDCDGDVAGAL